jgi:hypothetical protein
VNIGEPLRTIVVEPLEVPVNDPASKPDPEPVVGHRIWGWDGAGLISLNGEYWVPRQAIKAICKTSNRAGTPVREHQAPQLYCFCGVYATKTKEPLHAFTGFHRISGEVYLWGTVVEHSSGWRAQFAYPKSLTLLPYSIPYGERESKVFLNAITGYGADLYLAEAGRYVEVWSKSSGFLKDGLDRVTILANQKICRRLRVAVFAENEERLKFLQDRIESARVTEVVHGQVGLPSDDADSIFQHLKRRGTEVVLVDLVSPSMEAAKRTFRVMRCARSNVALLPIIDPQDRNAVVAALSVSSHGFINRKNPQEIAEALRFEHCLTISPAERPKRSRQARSGDRPRDRWPGPPAIPVHSVADILRILRNRRPEVQVPWTLCGGIHSVKRIPFLPRLLSFISFPGAYPGGWAKLDLEIPGPQKNLEELRKKYPGYKG